MCGCGNAKSRHRSSPRAAPSPLRPLLACTMYPCGGVTNKDGTASASVLQSSLRCETIEQAHKGGFAWTSARVCVDGRMTDTLPPHANIARAGAGQLTLTTGARLSRRSWLYVGFIAFFQKAPKVLTMRTTYRRELLTSAPRGAARHFWDEGPELPWVAKRANRHVPNTTYRNR